MVLLSHDAFLASLEATDCAICYETIKNPLRTDCGHVFCLECAKTWFATSSTCPTCRTALCQKPAQHDKHARTDAANRYVGRLLAPNSPPPSGDRITIKVLSPGDDREISYVMRPTTRMGKLMESFSNRVNMNHNVLRFLFDGQRIHRDDTAEELDIQDGDDIHVYVEQIA